MQWNGLNVSDYAHGDLGPVNILLDAGDTIEVGNFDSTVRIGKPLLVATATFCKLEGDYEAPIAGDFSEQYAVGSCIYNIRLGHEPFHDIDGPVMLGILVNNESPPTSNDGIFGDVVLRCWCGSIIPTHFRGSCEIEKIGSAELLLIRKTARRK